MRILIVSSGLKPDRFGGLPSHVEDLIGVLVENGQDVAYLDVGAKSRWPLTQIKERRGLACRAWNLTSKLAYTEYWTGTKDPLSQINSTGRYRRKFWSVIERYKPDLIHLHDVTGFPIGLISELNDRSIGTIFSAHDFNVLCPTVKLFRPDQSFCTRSPDQLDCGSCCLDARSEQAKRWEHVNDYWLSSFIKARNLVRRSIRLFERCFCRPATPSDHIQRRKQFEQIFSKVDVVLATSRAQQRILEQRTKGWNIRFLQLSRKTIHSATSSPRLLPQSPGKLVFVALNIVNPAKGLSLLEEAFAALHQDHPEVELNLYGPAEGKSPGIRYLGPYEDLHLDEIIGAADFGILPSLWPEAFGYVGPEMLSRGLPVVASNRGAMPDYVTHGVNGLLFDPQTPGALENSLRDVVNDLDLRRKLWRGAAHAGRHYLSMEEHTEKIIQIYRDVINQKNISLPVIP